MRFATVLAATSAIALGNAAPVVHTEGAVPDVPHRDTTDYYKVVAPLRTGAAKSQFRKTYTLGPQAAQGITVQQAKRQLILEDPMLNKTVPVRPELRKPRVDTYHFCTVVCRLWPCSNLCEAFRDAEKKPSPTRGHWCKETGKPSVTQAHEPKETGKPSSTEGHGPKETGKPSTTKAHGSKETGKPQL
ncbi:hypothetical protein J3458_004373 [Metarhizium acridum]|uniref:Uncharacterized protein n=1 Tax=Metarhizium acridum (strain CQMa 102) TaxID=655827 RepID=E9DVR1_METAQ|nr:uncharacterized protein MAC_01709 [Metarhizium acridum CQMa 102]EFY92108.1 hypothetical protein MAC_01709 [Metarhizium acridum CQMa 102]KAG8419516.1 hypothetical protein J3458_004373 [Metarhizium acridum]